MKLKINVDDTSYLFTRKVNCISGSYVVRSELPELLSKAMKKVTGLESKVRDLERQNEKLEKRSCYLLLFLNYLEH